MVDACRCMYKEGKNKLSVWSLLRHCYVCVRERLTHTNTHTHAWQEQFLDVGDLTVQSMVSSQAVSTFVPLSLHLWDSQRKCLHSSTLMRAADVYVTVLLLYEDEEKPQVLEERVVNCVHEFAQQLVLVLGVYEWNESLGGQIVDCFRVVFAQNVKLLGSLKLKLRNERCFTSETSTAMQGQKWTLIGKVDFA